MGKPKPGVIGSAPTPRRGSVPAVPNCYHVCSSRGQKIWSLKRKDAGETWGCPTSLEKAGGRNSKRLLRAPRAGSPQIPRVQGANSTPGSGKRTKQVGGLGLGCHPALPAHCHFCGLRRPSPCRNLTPHGPAAGRQPFHLWGLGEGDSEWLVPSKQAQPQGLAAGRDSPRPRSSLEGRGGPLGAPIPASRPESLPAGGAPRFWTWPVLRDSEGIPRAQASLGKAH